MNLERELDTAVNAVAGASRLARAVRSDLASADAADKADRSPVTVADFGVQALICRALAEAFPQDGVAAEEEAQGLIGGGEAAGLKNKVIDHVSRVRPGLTEKDILEAIGRGRDPARPQGRWWALDPVDGTKGFIRGDQYALALALVVDGRVVLGVLGCPNLPLDHQRPDGDRGCLFYAAAGRGAYVRPLEREDSRRILVSEVADPSEAVFCESFESAHSAHDRSARAAEILGVRVPPIRMDSQAKYGAVARGQSSIYLRLPARPGYQQKVWDHAAGSIIVTEAGGEVTDVRGRPLDFSHGRTLAQNEGVVATNGIIHSQALEAVARVMGPA